MIYVSSGLFAAHFRTVSFDVWVLVCGILAGSLAVQIVDPQLTYQFGKQFGRIVAGTLLMERFKLLC